MHAHQTALTAAKRSGTFSECCSDIAPGWAVFNHAEQAATFTHLAIWKPYCTAALMWLSGVDLNNPL